jgi:hypothetical protein
MPIKDLKGPPRPTPEELALEAEIEQRLGLPRRRRGNDDGLEPVPENSGPGPAPLAGGAEAAVE